MNFHGKDIKIFTCNSNIPVAQQIAACLGIPVGKSDVSSFSDGEIAVSLHESVRGSDCFIVQSTCAPVNDNIMELLIMIDAMRRASAARITAVVPYFGYARQDRKSKPRDPISAKLVADLITTAGADRLLTMDLHAAQIQGFFNIPVDHLLGAPLLANYFKKMIGDNPDDYVVVSPDLGSVTRARNFATRLGCPIAIIDKRRPRANVCEVMKKRPDRCTVPDSADAGSGSRRSIRPCHPCCVGPQRKPERQAGQPDAGNPACNGAEP